MARNLLLLAAAIVIGGLPATANKIPTEDSAVFVPGDVAPIAGKFQLGTIEASSGPSGENPTGEVLFYIFGGFGVINVGGPVTCLAVSGNTATINIQDQLGVLGIVTIQVLDGAPDTFDTFDASPTGRLPSDCSPLPPTGLGGALEGGDIVVVDAPADATPPSCVVTGVAVGPPKQQDVTVRDSKSGLKMISNIVIRNGTVNVPSFVPGTTGPVIVTATKLDQTKPTQWSFDAIDMAGNTRHCA